MDFRPALRRYGDLMIAGGLAVLLTTEVALWENTDHTKAIPAALLSTLPLALRRRTPLIAFVLTAAGSFTLAYLTREFDNNSLGVRVVFLVALYSLGRHSRELEAVIGAVFVLGTVVGFIIGDGAPIWTPGDVGFGLGFVGGPWAAGLAIRLRRDREQLLLDRNLDLQQEQENRAREAVRSERARIARELHDVVSHAISITVLQARGGRRMIGTDNAQARAAFGVIERINSQALGDMRRLLQVLREADDNEPTSPQPSLARLDALVDQLRASGLPVQLSVAGDVEAVPPGVGLSAYRIVQEALTNVLKHAGAQAEAGVDVSLGAQHVDIVVTDNGTGAGAGDRLEPGHGLIGIRERVAVAGGSVDVGHGETGGLVVRVQLPYEVVA